MDIQNLLGENGEVLLSFEIIFLTQEMMLGKEKLWGDKPVCEIFTTRLFWGKLR